MKFSIDSILSQTGKEEEDVRPVEVGDKSSSSGIQTIVEAEPLKGEKALSEADIRKIIGDSIEMDSIPPVPSLKQLRLSIKYDLVECIPCYNQLISRYIRLWSCAFEPDPNDPKKTTNIAAACGEVFIALVNCSDGRFLEQRLILGEDFRVLAWTTLETSNGKKINVLAAGGALKRILLFHSHFLVNHDALSGHVDEITSMIFHPSKPKILFSGDRQANILVWDINVPFGSTYGHYLLMQIACPRPSFYPVLSLVFMPSYDTLVASCGDGIFAWNIQDFRPVYQADKRPPAMMEIKIPTNHGPWFDGLARLSENLIVVNSVEEGETYVFDFGQLLLSSLGSPPEDMKTVTANILGKMYWPENEDIYVNVTARLGLGAVVFGNNKGGIWLYDLQEYVVTEGSYQTFNVRPIKEFDIRYPEPHSVNPLARRIIKPTTFSDISSDGMHMVCVTSKGDTCIWKFSDQ